MDTVLPVVAGSVQGACVLMMILVATGLLDKIADKIDTWKARKTSQ
jgi:hypothetical protein